MQLRAPVPSATRKGQLSACGQTPALPRAVSVRVPVGKASIGPLMKQGSMSVYRNRRSFLVPKAVLQEPAVTSSVVKHLTAGKAGQVVQLYRYPGLSDSTVNTLLRKSARQ
ncbi:hypothetical protein TSOC_005714 [Tetrabaena socialis]|uniref:Uncharacterized protein n=1 Tax=Tetrabaena socialis TaxID=47790 RepID=A0A2J8A5I8_9CHLO|nr:hypothetical protein TSOC_005714 [Tetrabaena socialis]|eukprot:PNH07784.1 hypothetical protein TSOC_005714 [Tetrabaena socialis]